MKKNQDLRLKKLNVIFKKLRLGQHVQNRQLQTWLSEDEYAQIKADWHEQLELREELKDKLAEKLIGCCMK